MNEAKWTVGASARKMKEGADEAKSGHKEVSGQLLRFLVGLDKSFAPDKVSGVSEAWETIVGHVGRASNHYGEGLQAFRGAVGNLVLLDGPAKDINLIGRRALDLTTGEAKINEDDLSVSENLIQLSDDIEFIKSTLEVLRERLQTSMQRATSLRDGLAMAEEAGRGAASQLKDYRDTF